jgi:hypothetical protein
MYPHGPAQHKQNGGVTLRRDALDYQGSPCANAGASFDFCDECLPKITDAINDQVARIRADIAAYLKGRE